MLNLIVLNGVSSSGKTTIGKVIQSTNEKPYYLIGIDHLINMRPQKHDSDDSIIKVIKNTLFSASSILYHGTNAILDIVFFNFEDSDNFNPKAYIDMINDSLSFFNIKDEIIITLVKITADNDILLEREILRNDRMIGLAEEQLHVIHNNIKYDIEIDTTLTNPIQNAKRINEFVNGRNKSK